MTRRTANLSATSAGRPQARRSAATTTGPSAADIHRIDLLRWIASWSALSGIWHLEHGELALASFPHAITDLALDRLCPDGSRSD